MPSFPVWSSPVEYLHVQCSTVVISFIRKRGMHFSADQCSEVQWLSCMVLSSSIQSSEVKLRLRQSSPVKCGAVQFSLLKSCPAHSSPVHSTDVRSSPFSEICARPVQFQFIPFQLSTFQSSIAQVHISQQQSSLIQSSAVQSSAIRGSSTPFRPVPSRPVHKN